MGLEYLFRRTDGEWFDFPLSRCEEVLRPHSFTARTMQGQGDHRIEINGCEISFPFEDAGIQVCFKHDQFSEPEADQIVGEIAESITRLTGQVARGVSL